MNRRIRASTKPFSSSSPTRSEPFHKYLKPGAVAQIRDSRISAHRTHRVNSLYLLSSSSSSTSLHRTTPPSSPPSSNAAAQQTPVNAFADGVPCSSGGIYGPRCPQRKKLVAAKSVLFLNPIPNSVQDSPDSVIDSFILPVMLSSKLLPEMEVEDKSKREQLLLGMQNLPLSSQIEKLKARIYMIGADCESAEKMLADMRKAYLFGTRQGLTIAPTLDKGQSAKIQEQENLLRAAVNYGLQIPGEQRQITPALPLHLVDVITVGDGVQSFADASGMYSKNTPLSSNNISGQGTLLQASAPQLIGRSAASPSATTATSFDNTTTSPLQYANSSRSGTNMMNTPSPQQHTPQQLQQQQPRQKLMQLPQHQQQLLAQQQFRQTAMQGLGQNQLPQLHDLQGQAQQKFQSLHGQHQMQFSQSMGHQQFQGRQLPPGHVQHGIGQSQLNQGNQMNRHLSQFSSTANSALFNAAQATSNAQMIPNMSATMPSQSLLPRMQFKVIRLPPIVTQGTNDDANVSCHPGVDDFYQDIEMIDASEVKRSRITTPWNPSIGRFFEDFVLANDSEMNTLVVKNRRTPATFFGSKNDATQYMLRNPGLLNPKIDGGRWVLCPSCEWNTFKIVKNQGSRKICFAVSVISVIESYYKIVYGEDIILDLDELLFRYPRDYSDGGYGEVCLGLIMTLGAYSESHDTAITIDGFIKIPSFNEDYLLVAVAHQPVIASLKVGKRFQNWKGCGVYEGEDDALEKIDDSYFWHSIVISGYGEENGQKYFDILNSWGESWGDAGYIKVARGLSDERGVNGLYTCPMYPILREGWTIFDHRMCSYYQLYDRERLEISIPRCGICLPSQERKNHVPCPLVGKGKKQLCSNILELKKAYAEEMHGSINANYAAFMRPSKEILDLVGELSSVGNMLSTLAALIHGLAEGVDIDSLYNSVPEGSTINDLLISEAREPSELEKWLIEFPDLLDVLLAERRVDDALTSLDEGERIASEAKEKKALTPAVFMSPFVERCQKLADQLSEAACQPFTGGDELCAAIAALKKLGDGSRAHSLLLNAHLQSHQCNMHSLCPSSISYTAALFQLVFSAVAQAASDSLAIFGMYMTVDKNAEEFEWSSSLIFQELFAKLNRMATIAADMFVGRERFATLALMRVMETVISCLLEDQSFWGDNLEGPKPFGPLGLQQFHLDMMAAFAANGVDPKRKV